jgi:hypothetical protein
VQKNNRKEGARMLDLEKGFKKSARIRAKNQSCGAQPRRD